MTSTHSSPNSYSILEYLPGSAKSELQAKQNKEQIIKLKPCAKRWAARRSTVCHSSKQNASHLKNMKGVPIGML